MTFNVTGSLRRMALLWGLLFSSLLTRFDAHHSRLSLLRPAVRSRTSSRALYLPSRALSSKVYELRFSLHENFRQMDGPGRLSHQKSSTSSDQLPLATTASLTRLKAILSRDAPRGRNDLHRNCSGIL
ncbi:hypothetical protein BC834DRAFT_888295 [Gloeopeniophorella convolvens]|nr:hypothetical protein BC834DRAFT_888295 [Gloeopeniophorella convolvens]